MDADKAINTPAEHKNNPIDNIKMNSAETVSMATMLTMDNQRVGAATGANPPKPDIYDSTFSTGGGGTTKVVENLDVVNSNVSSKSDNRNVINRNDSINNNTNSTNEAPSNSTEINVTLQTVPNSNDNITNEGNIKSGVGSENSADILKQMRSTSVQVVPNSNVQTVPNLNIRTVSNSNIQIVPNLNIQNVPNTNSQRSSITSARTTTQQLIKNPSQIPIIGYEVMEERARFTIYKLRVDDPRTALSWLVFRRYTDFVRLHSKLKARRNLLFPLPEKRLFKDNFDPVFLDNRARGLQLFVNAVMKTLPDDPSVRDFFCLDEPPPAVGDSEPEAQALFGALEDTVGALRDQIRQKEEALEYLRRKVFYLEERSRSCTACNPAVGSPDSSGSSNGS